MQFLDERTPQNFLRGSSPSRILPYLIRQTSIWHRDYQCIHAAKILATPSLGELAGVGAGNGVRKDRHTVYLFAFARRQHCFATHTGYILKWQYPESINPIDSKFLNQAGIYNGGGLLLPKRNSTWLPAAILKNRYDVITRSGVDQFGCNLACKIPYPWPKSEV